MDVDAILEEKASVCDFCVDGGTYQCIKSEVPAPEGARLQARMGSISLTLVLGQSFYSVHPLEPPALKLFRRPCMLYRDALP